MLISRVPYRFVLFFQGFPMKMRVSVMLPFVLDMSLWSIMQQRQYFSELSSPSFSVVEKKVRSMSSHLMLKSNMLK